MFLHSCSNGGLKPVALCRNKGQHVADQVVEDVQVLLLVVAYDGHVAPCADSKAGEAAAARVLELEHVVLPRQLQRRALEVQRQPGHVVGPRPPRRREAELREQRRRCVRGVDRGAGRGLAPLWLLNLH